MPQGQTTARSEFSAAYDLAPAGSLAPAGNRCVAFDFSAGSGFAAAASVIVVWEPESTPWFTHGARDTGEVRRVGGSQ